MKAEGALLSGADPAEGKRAKVSQKRPATGVDRLQKAKLKAEKAIKSKKIFSIHGPYPLIRRALRDRGWVEKEFKLPARKQPVTSDDDDDDDDDSGVGASPRPETASDPDPDNRYGMMGRMVRNEAAAFQWTTRNSSIDWRFLNKDQLVNHYAKANFTTKVGLCVNLRMLTCFADADVAEFFPRCFRLSHEEDKLDFVDEFRRVAATAVLRIALDPDRKPCACAAVPQRAVELAVRACDMFAQERHHEDIDLSESACRFPDEDWEFLVRSFYRLAHEGAPLEGGLRSKCESALGKMQKLNPQLGIDGTTNTWIVKPGAKSRGRGISVMNRLDEILKLVQPALMKEGRWVIQKYIERPLLVFGTKFDIRQWFLVTDWNPMTVWMYRSSYLRFSTRPFSLVDLDPSVHLCNYSVQKNLEIDSKRHPMLPEQNMWSNEDFKRYLQSRGCESLWDDRIYPGMKKAIIHMCQTAQDVVDYRKGSFELYGADFMIDENYNPWLIEINSSPTMSRSTAVTHKLCATVQEDTLKVVLDRRKDKNCDLGLFELAFKQPVIDVPLYVGKSLQVEGTAVRRPGGGNNTNQRRSWAKLQPTPPRTSGQESKPVRSLSQPRQQSNRIINRPQVSKTMRATPERAMSPVKLRMQNTMNRLTSEVKSTPLKQNALSLPRFSSNSNTSHRQSHSTLATRPNKASSVGGFHCVSTTQAKAASSMGIIHHTLVNRHQQQVIVPKTFPPSLVPGCSVASHRGLPASGVVAVAPHNFGLTLPLQRLLGSELVAKSRHMEIYNYPSQDFRMNGRQRVSGRLY